MITEPRARSAYLDNSGRDDRLAGGVKRIPIATSRGIFHVWTKRWGNDPTMKVLLLRWMAETLPRGRYLHCPNGSHLAMYDDQETYFRGLIQFITAVDAGMV